VSPAHTEFDDRVPACGDADPGGLGGDEGLKVEEVQQGRLDDLRLREGGRDPDDGLVRKHQGTLGHRVKVAEGSLKNLELRGEEVQELKYSRSSASKWMS
jgi:hypothetical protein